MAYGSPSRPEDVRPYLEDVRGGRPVSDEAVEELAERYRRIGGRSPLDDLTEAQRAALERELGVPVFVGMKHWQPRIAEAVGSALAGGAARDLAARRGTGGFGALVVRLPERERDRRALARAGCARRARPPARGGRGQGARRANWLRLGPPRDPLGPRHRGAGACRRARARARADRVPQRRPRLRACARRARRGAAGRFGKESFVSSRSCPDWPLLMEIA